MNSASKLVAACVAAGLACLACVETAGAETATFGYTGGEQTFIVPAGVTQVGVTAVGARGGSASGAAGFGAVATATLPVTPGEVLYVEVGGNGGTGNYMAIAEGGFNGGADGGGGSILFSGGAGGGGATDVRAFPRTPPSLGTRLVVAAGGGGGGGDSTGGAGGGAGSDGGDGPVVSGFCERGGGGGSAGTATQGGDGGARPAFLSLGDRGAAGGSGGLSDGGSGGGDTYGGGGGGGGGIYGGGGGASGAGDQGSGTICAPGGGGGGSSGFAVRATNTFLAQDTTGVPSLTFEYSLPAPPDVTSPALTSLNLSPTAFAAARRGQSVLPAAQVGTTVSYVLSEAAATRFKVRRARPGIRRGSRCARRPARPRQGARRCTRYVALRGGFSVIGVSGENRFRFRGRLRGRTLRPGRYQLAGRPTDAAGNRAARATTKRFRIVR